VLVKSAAPLRVRADAARLAGAKEPIPVRYVIAIPAFLACGFYVYVLIQLRRDEKRHKSPAAPNRGSADSPQQLGSFTAVRKPGQSFAEWSRLTGQRTAPEAGRTTSRLPKRDPSAPKSHGITYVELALPLSSGVAPVTENRERGYVGILPKKIA
jgi:hypothetical protein